MPGAPIVVPALVPNKVAPIAPLAGFTAFNAYSSASADLVAIWSPKLSGLYRFYVWGRGGSNTTPANTQAGGLSVIDEYLTTASVVQVVVGSVGSVSSVTLPSGRVASAGIGAAVSGGDTNIAGAAGGRVGPSFDNFQWNTPTADQSVGAVPGGVNTNGSGYASSGLVIAVRRF